MKQPHIFVTGLTSMGIGAMEATNLGNYIIIEPFIAELRKQYPDSAIHTSLQMSDEFCQRFGIVSLRNKRFWSYGKKTLISVFFESIMVLLFAIPSRLFGKKLSFLFHPFPMLKEIMSADILLDFSGDRYGDNAHVRQYIESNMRMFFARMLGKPVCMMVGSPGPFASSWKARVAKYILPRLSLLTVREPLSKAMLQYIGVKNAVATACTSFLFTPSLHEAKETVALKETQLLATSDKPTVGLIICGWNMPTAPYSKWPRETKEFAPFLKLIDHLVHTLQVRVCVMSHQNGFDKKTHSLEKGIDHRLIDTLLEQAHKIHSKDDVFTLQGLYTATESRYIISTFDMVISGRIHGAIQALSQHVPTAIIDYGHEPKAHKLQGFAMLTEAEHHLFDVNDEEQMKNVVSVVFNKRATIRETLEKKIPVLQHTSKQNFVLIDNVLQQHYE